MKKTLVVAAVAGLVALSACSDNTQLNDAPVGIVDDSPSFVLTNVDDFPNIAIRCFGENGIYTTTRDYGDAITIIVSDPECADGEVIPEGDK